jgi:LysR family transcriptional regulator, low CO2-responsive transcriptional regulator
MPRPAQTGRPRVNVERLPHLETFAKAAETGSFTAAARALSLTQAAVSQRVQALEKTLGATLFDRTAGHIALTDAGRRLYEYAQRILALHEEAVAALTGRKTPLTGELLLAASSVPGEHLLPDLLATFRKRHSHIQVRATVADTEQVLHAVEHGEAHLGLVGGKSDNPHLEFRRFGCDKLALVVRAKHPWRKRKEITLAELRAEPLILREAGSGSRRCLEEALAAAGKSLRELNVALELGSNEAIKEAVLRGMGVTVLSTRALERALQSGKLHALEVKGLHLVREMFAVWDRRRALPIPARLFLDLLESHPGGSPSP